MENMWKIVDDCMEKGGCKAEDLYKDINDNEVEETTRSIRTEPEEIVDKLETEGTVTFCPFFHSVFASLSRLFQLI